MEEDKPHVLIVEDNEINQKVIRIILERYGCTYELAIDGEEALRMFEPHRFDLILMDCQMPKMNGLQATAAIRSKKAGEQLPILAMTANAMKGDRERCLEAGMNDFLPKPFKSSEVIEKIRYWMGERK